MDDILEPLLAIVIQLGLAYAILFLQGRKPVRRSPGR
jgi:hypothetical protein